MLTTATMDQPQPATPLYPAMALLNYMHAPTVGFYYMGACAFSLCILQKARLVSQKRRRSILISMLTILVAYITEVLYYFSRSMGDWDYEPPQPAAIRCLGSIL